MKRPNKKDVKYQEHDRFSFSYYDNLEKYIDYLEKILDLGDLKAGVSVKYRGKEYTIGNRHNNQVELYEGFKFYRVVSINQITIL